MQSSAIRVSPGADARKAARVADPEHAYRNYLAAIARHDIEAILEAMTEGHAQQLREMRRQRDFGPLFTLWCESQRDRLVITGCRIDADIATLTVRGRSLRGRIDMLWFDGHWRIAGERHLPLHNGVMD